MYFTFYILSIPLVAFSYSSFIYLLPYPLNHINVLLLVSIFLIINNRKLGLIWGLLTTVLLSLDAPYEMLVLGGSLLITLSILSYILQYFSVYETIYGFIIFFLLGYIVFLALLFLFKAIILSYVDYKIFIYAHHGILINTILTTLIYKMFKYFKPLRTPRYVQYS